MPNRQIICEKCIPKLREIAALPDVVGAGEKFVRPERKPYEPPAVISSEPVE